MGAYLTDHPPVRDQWYAKRNRPLTGCTVLHTAESIMDTIGPDTGAEAVAEFIRTRSTAGSYHDLVDSDSWIPLVDLSHGAYHDGTGSNNWALSLSFACRTTDWRAMSPEKRRGFLRQGARAFAAQQAYRRSIGAPLTELRLITKAQSDRGESGFTYHGFRDPGRRTDPGVAAPNLFPFDEFIAECRAALGGAGSEEDDMAGYDRDEVVGRLDRLIVTLDNVFRTTHAVNVGVNDPTSGTRAVVLQLAGRNPVEVDADVFAAAVKPLLAEAVREGMAADNTEQADEIVDRLAERLTGA